MGSSVAADHDELRHPAGTELLWNESWYFDFAAPDGSLGGYVRLGLLPNLNVAWFWAYLVGTDRPMLAVRDHEAPLPRGKSLEIRTDGLWTDLTCETPNDHWSIGLEAFAVSLDDPLTAYGDERGDLVPFGLDLEWEGVGPVFDYPGVTRYEQACDVHGEILVGSDRIAFQGSGERDHSWGVRDWWRFDHTWVAARMGDGSRFHATLVELEGFNYAPGFFLPPSGDLEVTTSFDVAVHCAQGGLPLSGSLDVGDLSLDITPLAHAPVRLDGPEGEVGQLARTLCRFRDHEGRTGIGWLELGRQAWTTRPG